MNPIQTTEINQDEFNSDSALNLEVPESNRWEIPDRKTRKQWYQSTNPQIRSYITGNLSANIAGKGAKSLKRASDEYQYLSEDLARHSYSSKAMSEKYDNFNGIDLSLLDKALENESKQLDAYQQQFNTGQLSERKFNRLQRKHGRRINNLNENYQTLSEVWHNKHDIPLVRTQSSVSPAPFVAGTIGMPLTIIGAIGGGAALPGYLKAASPYVSSFLSNPMVQGYFGYKAAERLNSKDGVQKTIHHFRNNEFGEGITSAAGDVLDMATIAFGVNGAYNAGRTVLNEGKQLISSIPAIRNVAASKMLNQNVKTTSLNSLNSLDDYNQGNVRIYEESPGPVEPHVSYVAEQTRLHPKPTTLSTGELAGIPKVNRNQPITNRSYDTRQDVLRQSASGGVNQEIFAQNVAKAEDDMLRRAATGQYNYDDLVKDFKLCFTPVTSEINPTLRSAPENVRAIKTYIQGLPDEVGGKFANVTSNLTGEVESYYLTEYRNYLRRQGVNPDYFTTNDLQRLLTSYEKSLRSNLPRNSRDVTLWHSSNNNFDRFNLADNLGSNTHNNGAYGPGNYFTTDFPQMYGQYNQPFVAKVKHFAPGKEAVMRGAVSRHDAVQTWSTKRSVATFGPNTGPYPVYPTFQSTTPYEVAIFGDKNIKSLYPHPSRFTLNSDGTASFIPTNWNDARFNYKTGGNLIKNKSHTKKYFK